MNSAAGRDVLSPARTFEVRQVILEHISQWSPAEQPEFIFFAIAALISVGFLGCELVAWISSRRGHKGTRPSEPVDSPRSREEIFHSGLSRTRGGLLSRLQQAWGGDRAIDERLAELEEALVTADVGVATSQQLLAQLRKQAKQLKSPADFQAALRSEMATILGSAPEIEFEAKPHVILVAGVNGVGKTTTIGKLAHRYTAEGKKVLLVAADTFRAGAAEQLTRWAERADVDCVRHQGGSDPSAVVFDGLKAAVARKVDIVLIDTAGRLHVKKNLIEELKKLLRVIKREISEAPHESLLVIDGTTGQNAIAQARVFQEALSLTGIILTKLDGTAKGGATFAVRAELGIPIRDIGMGERASDLAPFDPALFLDALFANGDETGMNTRQ